LKVALVAVALAACTGEVVEPAPLGDYTQWDRIDRTGPAPGHGDTYRIIYANGIARTQGTTAKDAVLVKEIHDNDGGAPGALRYVAIMRKLRAGPSPEDEGGWLFTRAARAGATETHDTQCWNRCHVQAPLAGVWLDYTATRSE
jgi:hypothetical protein